MDNLHDCLPNNEDSSKIIYVAGEDIDVATDQLLNRGFVEPSRICPKCIEEIHTYLAPHEMHVGAHVAAKCFGTSQIKPDAGFYCYDHAVAVGAPGLFNLAVALLPIAESLFGEEPVLYSMNIYGVRGGKTRPGVNEFHRDYGDTKQCALFMYLSNVDHFRDGPFQYVQHSQRDPFIDAGMHGPEYDTRYRGGLATIYGGAGTIFMFDPRGEHRAVPAMKGDRLAFWARYGVSERPADYVRDKLSPVDARILRASHHSETPKEYDDYAKRCTRLLIDW